MKIVITGSLGNIGKPLNQQLISKGHTVTVISSNTYKISEIEAIGAVAKIGLLDNIAFLGDAFSDADAVFCMIPPSYTQPDQDENSQGVCPFLAIHPNQLNTFLKRHTGQNVSTHIKTRLLEETKAMLIRTDLIMQEIGYSIVFADQPNFTQFLKKT